MTDKPVSEMSAEELLDEIRALRDRRAQARERRQTSSSASEEKVAKRKGAEEVSGDLGSLLDDILGDA